MHARPSRPELVLALSALAVVPLLLLLAEGGLALADRAGVTDATATGINELHRYSETYGWEPRPGGRSFDAGIWTTINADGYRGRRVPRAKSKDLTRIVLLGDSVAFGIYVADDASYASLLDSRDNGLEVVNLAVQGYGPGQSLLRLENVGMGYQPDIVMLAFCESNDFADDVGSTFLYDGAYPKAYYTVEGERLVKHDEHLRLAPARRAALWLQDRSRLYRLFWGPSPKPARAALEGAWLDRRRERLRERDRVLDTTSRILARMREVSEAGDAAFVLVLHPDADGARLESPWMDALRRSPRLARMTIVSLAERYAARRLAFNEVARDAIGHLSPLGHQRTARILEEALIDEGLAARGTAASLRSRSSPPPR